ncbi:MAG: hypothetical protein ACOC9P_00355 [bacterium]
MPVNPNMPSANRAVRLISSELSRSTPDGNEALQIAMKTIECLILAHVAAGVDVTTSDYVSGLETAVDGVQQAYGSSTQANSCDPAHRQSPTKGDEASPSQEGNGTEAATSPGGSDHISCAEPNDRAPTPEA